MSQNNTLIETIVENNEVLSEEILYEKLYDYIFDLSLELDLRLQKLSDYFRIHGDQTVELISRLGGMYMFSGARSIEKYLYNIVKDTNLSTFLKFEAVQGLFSFNEEEETIDKDDDEDFKEIKLESNLQVAERNKFRYERCYDALNYVCSTIDENFATPCRVDAVCLLMHNDDYKDNTAEYFTKIINDQKIECDYRYKTILSLDKKNIKSYKFYSQYALIEFLYYPKNMTMYRILSGQNLLQNFEMDDSLRETIEYILLSFAKDDQLDYNLRADASDTLLTLGSENMKIAGREIITVLGRISGKQNTVYDNAQNVHVGKVEESVSIILQYIVLYPTLKIEENEIDFNYVYSQILKIMEKQQIISQIKNIRCKNCNNDITNELLFCSDTCSNQYKKFDKITIALNRISVDRTLYNNNALTHVLVKLWSYIMNHKDKDEMVIRLLDELEDVSGRCSSGFLSCLLNVLSGFGELSIKISFEDQIIANFTGRLNAYARKITDKNSIFYNEELNNVVELYLNFYNLYPNLNIEDRILEMKKELGKTYDDKIDEIIQDFAENVVNQMTETSDNWARRQCFLCFFRTYMSKIREELFNEFKEYVDNFEFDLFIRKAISIYEGTQDFL